MALRLGVISLMVGLGLAGCGFKGALEAPSAAKAAAAAKATPAATSSADPAAASTAEKPVTTDKPFILDGLI